LAFVFLNMGLFDQANPVMIAILFNLSSGDPFFIAHPYQRGNEKELHANIIAKEIKKNIIQGTKRSGKRITIEIK